MASIRHATGERIAAGELVLQFAEDLPDLVLDRPRFAPSAEPMQVLEELAVHIVDQVGPGERAIVVELAAGILGRRPAAPPMRSIQDGRVGAAGEVYLDRPLGLQVVQIFQEQEPAGLLDIVELGGAPGLFHRTSSMLRNVCSNTHALLPEAADPIGSSALLKRGVPPALGLAGPAALPPAAGEVMLDHLSGSWVAEAGRDTSPFSDTNRPAFIPKSPMTTTQRAPSVSRLGMGAIPLKWRKPFWLGFSSHFWPDAALRALRGWTTPGVRTRFVSLGALRLGLRSPPAAR